MTAQIKHIAIITENYTLLARIYEALFGMWTFPGVDYLKRPSNRPFVGVSMNDPARNVFDLAHADKSRHDSVYACDADEPIKPADEAKNDSVRRQTSRWTKQTLELLLSHAKSMQNRTAERMRLHRENTA